MHEYKRLEEYMIDQEAQVEEIENEENYTLLMNYLKVNE